MKKEKGWKKWKGLEGKKKDMIELFGLGMGEVEIFYLLGMDTWHLALAWYNKSTC